MSIQVRTPARGARALRLTLLGFAAAGALIEGAQAAEPAAPARGDQVEEVVVTAQKRTENAQSVPVSIQSLTSGVLEKIGAKDVRDVELIAPSVSFADGSEQGRTGIRGIVDYSRNAGYDARVGVYIDGVYLGRSYLNNSTLLGIQQIDVLRGPQGTLFGKDTDAGVISITTRKPSDAFFAMASAEGGAYGEYRVAGLLNGQVAPDLDAEVAATKQGSDGYYRNVLLGKENEGTDQTAERLEVRYHPGSRLDLLLSLDGSHQHNSTLHYTYAPKAGTNVYDFSSYNNDYAVVDSYGASLAANYNLDAGWKLTSISAFRGGAQLLDFNNETGALNLLTPVFHEVTSQYSEEARIASPVTETFDFVAGVFVFHQLNDENTKDLVGSGISAFAGGALKIYANRSVPYGAKVTTDSYAGFFNGNYRLNPTFELTVGLRYTDEIKALRGFYASDPFGVFGGNFSGKSGEMTDTEFTPKVGLNVHALKNVLLFADIGTGFKGGAFNIDNTTPAQLAAGIEVKPETVTSYEIGVKSDFFARHARINITAFRESFKNFQVFTFVTAQLNGVAVSTTSLANAGSVASQGIEFEGVLLPFEGLTLSANYTYNDSHFVSYPGGGGTVGATVINADGAQTPYAPFDKAYLSADYVHSLWAGLSGFAHLGYEVQTSENFDPKHVNPVFGVDYDIPATASWMRGWGSPPRTSGGRSRCGERT